MEQDFSELLTKIFLFAKITNELKNHRVYYNTDGYYQLDFEDFWEYGFNFTYTFYNYGSTETLGIQFDYKCIDMSEDEFFSYTLDQIHQEAIDAYELSQIFKRNSNSIKEDSQSNKEYLEYLRLKEKYE